MPTPATNFSDPTGLSRLLTSLPALTAKPKVFNISLTPSKCFFNHIFFRFGILAQNGTVRKLLTGTSKPTKLGKIPQLPTGRQIIITFPPNYRLRGVGGRPLKGQLWPRTR